MSGNLRNDGGGQTGQACGRTFSRPRNAALLTLLLASTALIAVPVIAWADGGTGGSGSATGAAADSAAGGLGGTDSTAAQNGTDGNDSTDVSGGGGGGGAPGGGAGGAGGSIESVVLGGAGGTSSSPDGGTGGGNNDIGGGGGGGAGGVNAATGSGSYTGSSNLSGGTGGIGGDGGGGGTSSAGGGGGGGAGGYGLVLTGSGLDAAIQSSVTVRGGTGGVGGDGGSGDISGNAGNGGNGGGGSAGIAIQGGGTLAVQSSALVQGGTGGTGGAGGGTIIGRGKAGFGGSGGAGGAGIALQANGTVTLQSNASVHGGAGGAGGAGGNNSNGLGSGGNGSIGGGGGAGIVFQSGGTLTIENGAAVNGGAGGTGGAGGSIVAGNANSGTTAGNGGTGGDGGAGIVFQGGGTVTVQDGALVQGGAGATGGAGGSVSGTGTAGTAGGNGAGGAAITGAGLTVSISGAVNGGLGGDGVTRGDAVDFTGGISSLMLNNGAGALTGGVGITGTLSIDPGGTATLSNVIHDLTAAGSLTKTGAGTLTLSGANTYSGGTILSAGILDVQNNSALGTGALTLNGGTLQAGASSLTLNNTITLNSAGGTIDTNGSNTLSLQGAITGATGTLTVTNTGGSSTGFIALGSSGNSYSGATIIGDGSHPVDLSDTGGVFSPNSAMTVNANASLTVYNNQTIASLAGAGTVQSGGISSAPTLITGGDNSSTTFSGVIRDVGSALSLTKTGAGTFTLSGTNAYSGGTRLSAGTINVQNSSALGTGTLRLDGGILQAGTNALTLGNAMAVNTTGGAIDTGSVLALTLGGAITNGNGTTGTLSLLSSSGTSVGYVYLTSSGNTYSGATVIGDGIHRTALENFGGGSFSPNSAVTVNANADLILSSSQTIASLAGAGAVAVSIANPGGTATLTVGSDNSSTTFSGTIFDLAGKLALTKAGAGTITLTGSNTYAGATTISAGTLALSSSGSIAASSLVTDNGTFDISGAGGSVSITDLSGSGTVKLGANSLTITSYAAGGFSGSLGVVGDTGGVIFSSGGSNFTGTGHYTGATVVNAFLNLENIAGFAVSSGVEVDDDLHLNVAGGNFNFKSLSGNGVVEFANQSVLTLTAAAGTFAGRLNGNSTNSLAVTGGTETLTGNNLGYGGGISVGGGAEVIAGGNTALGTGTVTMAMGSTLGFATSGLDLANNFALTGDPTVFVDAGQSETLSGVLSDNGAPGVVEKTGAGTLILTAANTYTGGTNIGAGTLALSGTASLSGSSGVNLATGARLDISGLTNGGTSIITLGNTAAGQTGSVVLGGNTLTLSHASSSFGGVIGSTGGGLILAAGTQTLTGTNTYTGSTTINGGTLALSGSGSIAPSSSVDPAAGATFDISAATAGASIISLGQTGTQNGTVSLGSKTLTITSGAGTFAGLIQDGSAGTGGSLSISGGTETLQTVNTYTGSTTISSGATLALSGSGSIAASNGVADAGTFDISGTSAGATIKSLSGAGAVTLGSETLTISAGAGSFSGIISDPGSLVVSSGSLTLTGTNTYTGGTSISMGVLQIGAGGTTGSISGSISDNGTLAIDRSDGVGIAGVISGSGTLVQMGGGITTISGADTYTGATQVNGGTLNVTGSIASSSGVTVAGGAILSGTGTVASTVIQSGATLSPGSSVATLTVSGNLTLASGATYDVDLSSSSADQVSVSGTASLAGALSANFTAGSYTPGTVYTLLTSTGLLSGTFDSFLDSNVPANILAQLSYDAHDVFLTLISAVAPPPPVTSFVWSGGTSDWNAAANWSGGAVPGASDTAEFGVTANPNLAISQSDAARSLQFDAGAPAYSIAIVGGAAGAASLTLSQGISDASSNAPSVTVIGTDANHTATLAFIGGNAADAAITAGAFGTVSFAGGANAGAGASLTANAGGTIDFSAASGTVSAGSIAGAGNILLGANTLTVGALDTSTTFSGVISGSGGLNKTGSGTLLLTGINTYTGSTTVSAGALSVNGSIGDVVLSGGTLKGSGHVGAVTMTTASTVAPGNSIGTLKVAAITFAPGSTYQSEVNASGQSDLINVTGAANLAGSVEVVEAAGNYAPVTTYQILDAGSISGGFTGVTSSLSNLTASLAYTSTGVDLKLMRNDVAFGSYGNTFNQVAAGTAVSAGGAGSVLYVAAANAYAANTINSTLDSLSGEIQASLRSAMVEDSHVIRDTMLERLAMPSSGTTVWTQGFDSSGVLDSDGNAARTARNYTGAAGGVDMGLGAMRLGLGGSVGGKKLSIAARGSSATGSSASMFGYAGWTNGPIAIDLGGSYGWDAMHIARAVAAFSETDTSSRQGTTGEVFAEASYDIELTDISLMPYATLDHVQADTGAFSESGGVTALQGTGADFERTYVLTGARLRFNSFELGGLPLIPRFGLAWSHGFGDATPAETLAFRGTGQTFGILGTPDDSDTALVSLGADLDIAPGMPLSFGYDGAFSNRGQANTVKVGISWTF